MEFEISPGCWLGKLLPLMRICTHLVFLHEQNPPWWKTKNFQQFVLVQAVMGSPGSFPGPSAEGQQLPGALGKVPAGRADPCPTLALCATEASLVFISLNNHAVPLL